MFVILYSNVTMHDTWVSKVHKIVIARNLFYVGFGLFEFSHTCIKVETTNLKPLFNFKQKFLKS
jgi:hypothetical protein